MLSNDQLLFLDSKDYFILKNEVDQELNRLLYSAQQKLVDYWTETKNLLIPEGVSKIPGKISKGYNYKGYPYQVFDFPSAFDERGIFSFRLVVWYGHFFSLNLLITNQFKDFYQNRLLDLNSNETYLLLSDKIWETDTSVFKSVLLTKERHNEIRTYFEKNKSIRLFRLFNMNQINDLNRLTVECFKDWFAK